MTCDTYWGSHGCRKPRGHGFLGIRLHRCEPGCGTKPYLGAWTNFYGDDVPPRDDFDKNVPWPVRKFYKLLGR